MWPSFHLTAPILLLLNQPSLTHAHSHPPATEDPLPLALRHHWMRHALSTLHTLTPSAATSPGGRDPCPFAAFGAVIVNHTAVTLADESRGGAEEQGMGMGQLVCEGVNRVREGSGGGPVMHGEIAAIINCTNILTDPEGPYRYTGPQALDALTKLSLYTTAEACPMCASAIAQANFAEYIFATSSPDLISWGWPQITIRSLEVFERSGGVQKKQVTRIVQDVLAEETDKLFQWQFQRDAPCPVGCARDGGGVCSAGTDHNHDEL